MHRLYFVQSVGSGKVPSVSPHWKGATVVGIAGVVDVVANVVVVGSTVVGEGVDGQVPMTHKFLV